MKIKTNSSPKSRTLSEEAWYRFKKNRLAVIAMILLIRLWVHRKIPCKRPQIGVQ